MSAIPPDAIEGLVRVASEVREWAYAPYSRFRVGAAVLAGGNVYAGANVENASYPLSVCAERNAVAAAIAAGETRIDAVAVVADGAEDPTPPCGGCRQVLNEFGPEMRVVSASPDGPRREWALSDLLPDAFGPSNLLG